ncbi:MAG: MlaD family protein [Longimicrobiales bacterium]
MPLTQRLTRRVLGGSLLILGLIATAVAIFFLDDLVRAFERRTTIVALLPDAPDLAPGAPVWIAGQRVGRVLTIEFLPRTTGDAERVALTLEIPERLRPHLDPESYARITSARLIGSPVVDLVLAGEGDGGAGDTLAGRLPLASAALMARVASVRARFDTLASSVRALGASPALRDGRLAEIERRFAAVARELDAMRTASAGGSLSLLLDDPALRQGIDRLSATTDRLGAVLGSSLGDRGARMDQVRAAFSEVAADAGSLSANIGRLRADSTPGTLGRFAADSALAVALHRLQAQLDSLVDEARSNPFRFVF